MLKLPRILLSAAIAGAGLCAAAMNSYATTIEVTPWLAPNAFGSPSFSAAVANQQHALLNGLTSYGAAGPTQYNANSTRTAAQGVVTGFNPGWASPTPAAPNQNELGNRMAFGVLIDGQGSQFSISQLSFSATSTDGGGLSFGFAAGSYN